MGSVEFLKNPKFSPPKKTNLSDLPGIVAGMSCFVAVYGSFAAIWADLALGLVLRFL